LASDAVALQSPPVATKSDMNGTGSKIEIFKPFGEAFELMKNFDATAFAFGN
jgi:hypothetical protein